MISTILIEDETLLRMLLRKAMETDGRFQIAGEAADGERGLALCLETRPELILLDLQMPKLSGIELAWLLKKQLQSSKIVVLSAQRNPAVIRSVLEAGVQGFVDKRQTIDLLMNAIVRVAEGGRYYSEEALEVLGNAMQSTGDKDGELSVREKQVLKLLAQGMTNKGVAFELAISELTVKTHRQNIHKKLNIHDTAALTRYAIDTGQI